MKYLVVSGREVAIPEAPTEEQAPKCSHIWLVARREAVENLAREGRSTRFQCEACGLLIDP